MLSETKLAIDDLYERTKEQSKKKSTKNDSSDLSLNDSVPETKPIKMSYDDKSYTVKLHALQFRVLDLEDIIRFEGVTPSGGKKYKKSLK